MKREDDQQLWDLLGQAPSGQLSPFFARNVVRRIREQRQGVDWLWRWLTPRKLAPITGLAIAILAAAVALHQPSSRDTGEKTPDVIAKIDPQDYDVVADLDELLVTDEIGLWDDDAQTL